MIMKQIFDFFVASFILAINCENDNIKKATLYELEVIKKHNFFLRW
jgi:hypothetical protein